jgi:phosphonate transport system substrate-binding protein
VFARNSGNPRRDAQRFQPFADYLAPRLHDVGIGAVTIRFANSLDQMLSLVRAGAVDVLSDTIYGTLVCREQAGTETVLLEHRGGQPYYHSVLFAREDSAIAGLGDLLGRRIAFEDRASTSSYILPVSVLRAAGLPLVELAPHDPVPPDRVGYTFAGSELNVSTWVHRRLADAGALSNLDWMTPRAVPDPVRSALRVFHQSPPVIRALLSVRPGLDPLVRGAMIDALLRMHEDEDGRAALRGYYGIARFAPIAGEAEQMLAASSALLRPAIDALR